MKQQILLLIGCAAASIIGVGVGMLIAPDSGENIRKDVYSKGVDWLSKFTNNVKSAESTAHN